MRELAADGIPVALTCRVLGLSRAPYHRWLSAPVGAREVVQAHRANALVDAHRDDPEFGYRFLADEARAAGDPMAARTAWGVVLGQPVVVGLRQAPPWDGRASRAAGP